MDGVKTQCPGKLCYRGYDINDLVYKHGDTKLRFEEAAYLLLFGSLPNEEDLDEF